MTKIGYARVSSTDQHLDRQLKQLKDDGCDSKHIFKEKLSGKNTKRPELKAMIDFIREDDIVYVYSLDRLSRNYDDIQTIVEKIKSKKAKLVIDDLPQTHTGNSLVDKFMLDTMINLMGFVAQNEREKIRERQRQGIAIAKSKGLYHGRPKKYTDDNKQVKKAIQMYFDSKGHYTMQDIADFCNMSRSTVYRSIWHYKAKQKRIDSK